MLRALPFEVLRNSRVPFAAVLAATLPSGLSATAAAAAVASAVAAAAAASAVASAQPPAHTTTGAPPGQDLFPAQYHAR